MSQHTPGPWTVGMGAYKAPRSRIDIRGGDTLPGAVAPPIVASIPRAHDRATCHANARLIAAAPDLLAALRELVTLWDSPEPFTGADALQAIGEATERARAAIAKAREGATD